jgi:hypothetical protein
MLQYADQGLTLCILSQLLALHHEPNSHSQLQEKEQQFIIVHLYISFRRYEAMNDNGVIMNSEPMGRNINIFTVILTICISKQTRICSELSSGLYCHVK